MEMVTFLFDSPPMGIFKVNVGMLATNFMTFTGQRFPNITVGGCDSSRLKPCTDVLKKQNTIYT